MDVALQENQVTTAQMRSATLLFAATALVITAASDAPKPPSRAAEAYFQAALSLLRQHHRNSTQANWPRVIARARTLMAGTERPDDTYPAIRALLDQLGERHSFLIEPSAIPSVSGATSVNGSAAPAASPPMPSWTILHGRFGMLRLPELNTLSANGVTLGNSYANSTREGLRQMDEKPLCGWIVDLRENGGGNMWPMLGGLDPLLGTGPFGFFVLPDGSKQAWVRAEGRISPATDALPASPPAFTLTHSSALIAVLIGPQTGSSGEMTAIALIGRASVRVFGSQSAGMTTGNKVYPLGDGAVLVLTETAVRDRSGKEYTGSIVPDEQAAPAQAEESATRWLDRHCRRSS